MTAKYPAAMYGPEGKTRLVQNEQERQQATDQGWTSSPNGAEPNAEPQAAEPAPVVVEPVVPTKTTKTRGR